MHGGEINVQSKVGEGTIVAVALPLLFTPLALREPASNVATLTPSPAPRSTAIEQTLSGEEKCLESLQWTTRCRADRRGARAVAVEAEERGLLMRILLHSPKDVVAGLLALPRSAAVVANALFHTGRPPPVADVRARPAHSRLPNPLPRPRPV